MLNMKQRPIYIVLLSILLITGGCSQVKPRISVQQPLEPVPQQTGPASSTVPVQVKEPAVVPAQTVFTFAVPIDRAKERIAKKPFGIQITPQTSPVQPERFSGYHTGVDFETFADEADSTVEIRAICSGKVLYQQWVSGYGGVFIQSCEGPSGPVTVLYGHLRLASISLHVGGAVNSGAAIGSLGKGYSQETDGERKHLHLSVHVGTRIELKGYVQVASDLSQWIDPTKYMTL